MAINRKNLERTLEVLKNIKDEKFFNMAHHSIILGNHNFVRSIIGWAACELDYERLKEYIGFHLVTNEPLTRWRSWAFDFYNVKGDIYDYLFSKQWAYKDNTLKGAIARIEYFLANGLPPRPKLELMAGKKSLSYRADTPVHHKYKVLFEVTGIADKRNEDSDLFIGNRYLGIADNDLQRIYYTDKSDTEWVFYLNDTCEIKEIIGKAF